MALSGAFLSFLFCLGRFGENDEAVPEIMNLLKCEWLIAARGARPSPKVIDWGGRSSHLMPGFDSESLPSLLLGNLS